MGLRGRGELVWVWEEFASLLFYGRNIIDCLVDESSSENGQNSCIDIKTEVSPPTTTTNREESESPKPMCVDIGEEEEEEKDVKEIDSKGKSI